ncbi:MAG: M24 family metallopeptidase [Anaerolineae bacterium]|jgi:Xaa-Pro aminopeptidase
MQASIRISREEHRERQRALAGRLQEQQLSGAVLFDNHYVLYYTGFAFIPTERPIAFVIDRQAEAALFVPRLEVEHAQGSAVVDRVEHYEEYPGRQHPISGLAGLLEDMGVADRIGIDTDGYPWILGYQGPSLSDVTAAEVIPLAAFVESQMAIKSAAEVALLQESAKWGNLAHRLLQRYTLPGITETEVSQRASQEATMAMVEALGPLYRAQSIFSTGASAGYRGQIGRGGALPHALSSNATFMAGDVIVTGAGAPLWGYHSELERTMAIGPASAAQARFFGHMVAVQEVALQALRPGALCSDVDSAVRAYYQEHDLMPYWRHHTGHAIGLRYHEGPFLDSGDHTPIVPGMVFTVEPGLYAEDLGGFRHSDTVLITEDGPQMITYYPRDLASLTIPV